MEYAARLPQLPTRRTMLAPVLALVVGAGAATGVYALVDNGDEAIQAAKVIVVEQPAPGTAEIPGKNESATAAAIAGGSAVTDIPGKNESATAAAIAGGSAGTDIPGKNESNTAAAISQSSGVELRGSKASATSDSAIDAETARRTDPHGPASSLRAP